ncbi:MAG: hypothetical protein ACYC4N_10280 [Pirellulaceae bacterium]
MVTKSLASTPFGWKLIYKIDGECIWSEYVAITPPVRKTYVVPYRAQPGGMLENLRRGVRSALFLKAS